MLQVPAPGGKKRPTRKGAAILEFAIVAPLIFLFVLGLIEISRGLMVTHLLTGAARKGCRLAVIEGKSNDDVTAAVNATLGPAGISSDSITVLVNDKPADASTAGASDEITVLVSVPVSAVTWVPTSNFLTGSLSGQYTLRRE
jgi:Flp pilus assembly protein TadG